MEPDTESSTQVSCEHRDGVLIVRPLGRLDRSTIERAQEIVATASAPVILDLDDCVLVDPRPLSALDTETVPSDAEVCIVGRRLTCRKLLARTGVTARFAVFTRIEDAMQALVFAREGHGLGWRMP